jgi:cobalt-zinc-cadmium efflux system outer membrane protein
VSRSRWGTTQAALRTAGQRPNPSLNVAPQYDVTTSVPSPWIVAVSIDIPIETAGKRGYRIARAQHLSDAARLDIAATAWRVRARLRDALVDLFAATEQERLLASQQAAQTENVRVLEGQLAAGAVSPAEVARERILLDRVLLAAQDAKRQRLESRVAVAQAMGLSTRALEGVDISFTGLDSVPPSLDPRAARRCALRNRADILAALSRYAASESALRLEIAKQYPDVHFSPGYEFDQGDDKWGVGLTLDLPLLNQNQGPIAEAEARRAESAADFNSLQASVLADIDRGLAGYGAAREKVATAEALLARLDKQARRLSGRYEAGDITRSELIGAQVELAAVRLARADSVAAAQRSLGRLEEALQSPVLLPTDPDLFVQHPRNRRAGDQP